MSSTAGSGAARAGRNPRSGRDRLQRAAYELFSRDGVRSVGVDAVIARAGVAKMTLYRNFRDKDDLILDFLQHREELWTNEWLIAGVRQRATAPGDRLLAVFDILAEWFARPDFEGCTFLTTMLEFSDRQMPARRASVRYLANIRLFLRDLATAAGVDDGDSFARQWHILMKGSIMAACEGDTQAAQRARELGELLLAKHGITFG